MRLAREAGSLLKIEEEIASAVAKAKEKWLATPKAEQGRLFADETAPPKPGELGLEVTGISDEVFWERTEERIYAALKSYAEQAEQERWLSAPPLHRGRCPRVCIHRSLPQAPRRRSHESAIRGCQSRSSPLHR